MNALPAQAQLRPMQHADLDAVMAIEPELYPYPWTRGNFSDSLHAGHSGWVYVEGDTLFGYAMMLLALDEAQLLNLSIAQPYQGLGWGSRLLQHMMQVARARGALNMFLEVRPSNTAAIRLYEKTGFNEMALRPGYYPAPQGREDAILMGVAL